MSFVKVIRVEREMGKNANEAMRVDFSRSLRLAALRIVKFDLKNQNFLWDQERKHSQSFRENHLMLVFDILCEYLMRTAEMSIKSSIKRQECPTQTGFQQCWHEQQISCAEKKTRVNLHLTSMDSTNFSWFKLLLNSRFQRTKVNNFFRHSRL